MSKCDLYLVFDKDDRTYYPGDEVLGAARVVVNKDVRCEKIFLRTEWRTHGKGNSASGAREEIVIAEGASLYAGQEQTIPFRFTVPDGPLTYHGKYLNVDWYARLQVDVPWAIDPKHDEDFLVIENPADAGRTLVMGDAELVAREEGIANNLVRSKKMQGGVLSLFGLLFFLPGLACAIASFFLNEGLGDRVGMFVIGSIFSLIGGIIVFCGLRNKIARKKIGEVQLDVVPMDLARGQEISVNIRCSPSDSGVIDNMSSVLTCEEVVVEGSGTKRTTYTCTVCEDVQERAPMALSGVRQGVAESFTHVIPETAPATFLADDNKVCWQVVVRISIKGWPDWVETRDIVVRY